MTPTRRRQVNDLAEKLRSILHVSTPVDMKSVVDHLGGTIKYVPPAAIPHEALVEKNGDRFIITLTSDKLKERRAFSIAHEVGHLFLHMGYLIDPAKWNKIVTYEDSVRARYGYNEEELEANEFAGAFLMPRDEFVSVADRYRKAATFNLADIAKTFGVSLYAAKTRGQWLGVFSWN